MPFCVKRGCINGSARQRELAQALAQALGWSPIDGTEMEDDAKWTPIFFNTDAVPIDHDELF